MNGKTDDEIKETRDKAIAALSAKGYEIVNTLFTDEWYKQRKDGRAWSRSNSTLFPC